MRIALPLHMLTKMTWIVNQLTAVDNTKAKIGMADQSKSMRNNNNCQSGMGSDDCTPISCPDEPCQAFLVSS